MKTTDIIAMVLLIIGGLNWGLVGIFEFDLVAAIFGGPDVFLADLVYFLVGLSALWAIFQWKPMHRRLAYDTDYTEPTTREHRRAA